VIGVPDPLDDTNEVPRAYVVVKAGEQIEAGEVQDFMKLHLSSYKQLRGGVVFVDEIPKSPSGKILRKNLRAQVAEEAKKLKSRL
jgi:4-coumarate--CoA ligase